MFKDKYNDIVIISSIDWNTQRQVIHELSEQLSKIKKIESYLLKIQS